MSTKLKKRPLREVFQGQEDDFASTLMDKQLMDENGQLSQRSFVVNHLSTLFPDFDSQTLKKTFDDSGRNIGQAIATLERMQAETTQRLGIQTSTSKTSKDQPPLDQRALDSEIRREFSGLLENLSGPTMQRLRSVAMHQIASTVPELSTCGDASEAHRLLETMLGKVLSRIGSNLAEVTEAYRQEGLKLKASYTLAKSAVHHLNATLGKRTHEKNNLENENERLGIENLRLREQNKFLLMELHRRDEPPGPHSYFDSNRDVF